MSYPISSKGEIIRNCPWLAVPSRRHKERAKEFFQIAGLEDIADGDIHIDGEWANGRTPRKRNVAVTVCPVSALGSSREYGRSDENTITIGLCPELTGRVKNGEMLK